MCPYGIIVRMGALMRDRRLAIQCGIRRRERSDSTLVAIVRRIVALITPRAANLFHACHISWRNTSHGVASFVMVFRKIKTFQVSQGEPHGRTLLLIKASMFLVILLALMAKESLGQTSQIHPADPTFRAQSEMVVVPFHVILGNQYIDDLNRADIVLLEDGKLRPFQIFEAPASHRRLAIELVLLFDTNAPRHPNADRGVNDFWNPTR